MKGGYFFQVGDRVKIVTISGEPTGTISRFLNQGLIEIELDKPQGLLNSALVYESQIVPINEPENKKSFFEEAMTGRQIYLGDTKVYPLYNPPTEEWIIKGRIGTIDGANYFFDKQGKYKLGPIVIEKAFNLSFEPVVTKKKVQVKKKIYIFSDNKTDDFTIHRDEDMVPRRDDCTVIPIEFSIFVEK